MTRRAVVTGVGVVAPTGLGADRHWKSTLDSAVGIRRIGRFDPAGYATRLAGEVSELDTPAGVESRLAVQTDRWTWMSFVGTDEALADAALDPAALDPYRMAVMLASSSGGNEFGQRELQRLWGGPSRTVGAYQSIAWFYAASVGQLSIRHQMKGHNSVLVSDAAGGLDSLLHAARAIRRGRADVVLAGGTEAPVGPYVLACQQRSGRLSTVDDATRAYLPFDRAASGFVPGEGGAILVVEEYEHARRRNAPFVYGEIVGAGATHDGRLTTRGEDPPSEHYARAMSRALQQAACGPDEVDVFFADGSAVPGEDRAETAAVRQVFGPDAGPPVTVPKKLTGRLYQGGSSLDVATALLAMRHGTVPPGAPDEPADGIDLDFVRSPRSAAVRTALVGARGFDGFNSALVVRRI